MWFSWRPKKSVALVESRGRHPLERAADCPGPQRELPTGRHDINRPAVVKRDGTYHMWYTGQARGHRWIGYATSPDGRTVETHVGQARAVVRAAVGEVAVMCPHVLWDEKTAALPDVVLGGRAVRAQRHRLRHQPGRRTLDQAQGQSRVRRRPGQPVGAAQSHRLPGHPAGRLAHHVLHRLSRREPRPDRPGPLAGRHHRLAAPSGQPDHLSDRTGPGTPTPATSPSRSSTARATAGCSGTTAAREASSKSAWRLTPATTSDSRHNDGSKNKCGCGKAVGATPCGCPSKNGQARGPAPTNALTGTLRTSPACRCHPKIWGSIGGHGDCASCANCLAERVLAVRSPKTTRYRCFGSVQETSTLPASCRLTVSPWYSAPRFSRISLS